MVRVEVTGARPVIIGCGGLKEHTGGIVTSGVIEAQLSQTPEFGSFGFGLVYPLIGLIETVPSAPLPAGTLPGETAVSTVTVKSGATESTVRFKADVECVVVGPVPVMTML